MDAGEIKETCGRCYFFLSAKDQGRCRRFPPQMVTFQTIGSSLGPRPQMIQNFHCDYPAVGTSQPGCGEFRSTEHFS